MPPPAQNPPAQTPDIATQWKGLSDDERNEALSRMSDDQKQQLASMLGFQGQPGSSPNTNYHKPLPVLPAPDALTIAEGYPRFLGQTAQAAGKNLSDVWQGVKGAASSAWNTLKQDPSSIVPMWFGGMMSGIGAAGKAVATPIKAASHGEFSDALSSAAGGNPEAARQYRDQGNAGGEFWEMAGKPLAMLGAGKALGMVGGAIPEGADIARLRVVRGLMRDTGAQSGTDLGSAQLAQQALQDAAREKYGTGLAGQSNLGKSLPIRDRGILDILMGKPLTSSRVEAGNAELIGLSRRAVEIAGAPADQINSLFGYMDGRQAAQSIKADLLQQANAAQQNGLTSYANALKQRAASMDGKATLGDIYNVKKAANKLSGVVKNTQESIDLMDSWSALASTIRDQVYPIYERQVQTTMPGFSIAQAGQKEGAAMALRNGLEKRLATAQAMSDELNVPGHITQMAGHGAPEHRLGIAAGVRKAQEVGLLPTEQGQFNKAGQRAIGPLSPDTVPENLQVTRQPSFGPAPPQTNNLLPGSTMKFQIPGNIPELGTEGQIAHPAEKVQGRHAFEQPQYTTSSSSREVSPTVYGPPQSGWKQTPIAYVKNHGDLDIAATEAKLPPVPSGYTRLFRSESPTTKFSDVFDKSKLQERGYGPRPEGNAYTDQLNNAAYYKQSYGRDASTHYIDVPNSVAQASKIGEGEYVINPKVRTQPIISEGRNINEGQMGANLRSAVPPEAQSDIARGAGTIETTDPKLAQNALDRMLLLQKQYLRNGATYQEQVQLGKAIKNLQSQLAAYQQGRGGAKITHVPPTMSYSARVSGNIPVKHSIRSAAPAAAADVEREHDDPSKWYNQR